MGVCPKRKQLGCVTIPTGSFAKGFAALALQQVQASAG